MIYSFTLYLCLFEGNHGVISAHRARVVKCCGENGGVSHDGLYCEFCGENGGVSCDGLYCEFCGGISGVSDFISAERLVVLLWYTYWLCSSDIKPFRTELFIVQLMPVDL